MIRSVARVLFGAWWTATVTTTATGLVRITGRELYIPAAQRLWARGLLGAWGVRVDVHGSGALRTDTPYILMANHTSHVDVPVLFSSLPFIPGFLAKEELGRIPFLSLALNAGGHVLIDRSDGGSALKVLKSAAREVRSGKTIAVFPEGTRGDGVHLGPFKRGGFLLAKKAGVPIVPIGIRGTHAVLGRDDVLPGPGAVSVHIGEPIAASDVRRLGADQLTARVRARIARLSRLTEEPAASAPPIPHSSMEAP